MTKSRFDYANNRWAGGDAALARRWYKELECAFRGIVSTDFTAS
jgi:hypothetical protein